MPARRRPSNPSGESPLGQPHRRGEEFDVQYSGYLTNRRIFCVMEQTVQVQNYHPFSTRLGMEGDLQDNLHPSDVQAAFQELEDTVAAQMREVVLGKAAVMKQLVQEAHEELN